MAPAHPPNRRGFGGSDPAAVPVSIEPVLSGAGAPSVRPRPRGGRAPRGRGDAGVSQTVARLRAHAFGWERRGFRRGRAGRKRAAAPRGGGSSPPPRVGGEGPDRRAGAPESGARGVGRDRVSGGRTALLVIDVQDHVLDPARHPPRPLFDRRARGLVLPTLARLLPAARAAGVEVVYTVMEDLTRDGRDRSLDYKLSGMSVPRGSPGARVAAEVAPEGCEITLPKSSACLFHSTAFEYVARNMGISRILCAGFLTDQCVEQTIKAGAARGFAMTCVEDACAANDPDRHAAALARLRGVARIRGADDVLGRG